MWQFHVQRSVRLGVLLIAMYSLTACIILFAQLPVSVLFSVLAFMCLSLFRLSSFWLKSKPPFSKYHLVCDSELNWRWVRSVDEVDVPIQLTAFQKTPLGLALTWRLVDACSSTETGGNRFWSDQWCRLIRKPQVFSMFVGPDQLPQGQYRWFKVLTSFSLGPVGRIERP